MRQTYDGIALVYGVLRIDANLILAVTFGNRCFAILYDKSIIMPVGSFDYDFGILIQRISSDFLILFINNAVYPVSGQSHHIMFHNPERKNPDQSTDCNNKKD